MVAVERKCLTRPDLDWSQKDHDWETMSAKTNQVSFRLKNDDFEKLLRRAGKQRPGPYARELLVKALSGERESLEQVIERHDREIKNALFRVCGFVMINLPSLQMDELEVTQWLEDSLFPSAEGGQH